MISFPHLAFSGLVLLGEGHGDSMCDKHLAMCKSKKPCVDNGKEYCFNKVQLNTFLFEFNQPQG